MNGLNKATGKYILFLDQDDEIADHCLKSQLAHMGNADVCIANGIMESENGKCLIYKNRRSQNYLKKKIGFIKVRDLIVSPGHCLIKRTSIPDYWKNHIMSVNSADDYFSYFTYLSIIIDRLYYIKINLYFLLMELIFLVFSYHIYM